MRQEIESPRAAATAPRTGLTHRITKTPVKRTQCTNSPSPKKWHERKSVLQIGKKKFVISGQKLRALLALVAAGDHGITALEVSTWAYPLGADCRTLRRLGVPISMSREPHEGGWHGRYRLEGKVKLHPVKPA
jgi:hypothetical protein